MNSKFKTYEANAVNLFRTSSAAILSTVSKKHDGYPFGSFITYVSSRNRNIFLYASDIAEHTKNLRNNSKACMTLFKIDEVKVLGNRKVEKAAILEKILSKPGVILDNHLLKREHLEFMRNLKLLVSQLQLILDMSGLNQGKKLAIKLLLYPYCNE